MNTRTGHLGKFGTTSIQVPAVPLCTYVPEPVPNIDTGTEHFGKIGTSTRYRTLRYVWHDMWRHPWELWLQAALQARAYHFFENVVDAHCVRDEGGFTVHWLLRFIRLGSGYICFREYVNHAVENAVRYPPPSHAHPGPQALSSTLDIPETLSTHEQRREFPE